MEYIKTEHYDHVRNDYGRELVIPSEKEWAEVKHGRWIEDKDRRLHWHCSECAYVVGALKMDVNFCPNCGAKMEDEE